jgi:D-arabinose 1-dehydrogenase-like Zn-dependent alcohol dehydrogenase
MAEATSGAYRAVQVTGPGSMCLVELPVPTPPRGHVRIRVEACGICHSDSVTVDAIMPIDFPRVPGHEVIGRIDAVGEAVSDAWSVNQRVGVGFLAGPCGECRRCRLGDFVTCERQLRTGVHFDGGYAEVMIAPASGLVAVPDDLDSIGAAPLLCAGVTTFKALRDAPVQGAELVAILGVGGLGHLAIQYAQRMGYRVVAIARGADKRDAALKLGAHEYVDSIAQDAAAELTALGGAQFILATAANSAAQAALIPGLAPGGTLSVIGVGEEPLAVSPFDLVLGERSLGGSLTGTPADSEATLEFSVLQNVRAEIERVPLAEAPRAYARMMSNEARFRMVLDVTR